MCSFLICSFAIVNLTFVNHFLKFRGPDHTNHVSYNGYDFVHNLLHMTGSFTIQPFVSDDQNIVAVFNGEIYNYMSFLSHNTSDPYRSDGECILDAYKMYGVEFSSYFDGEYAVVLIDFREKRAVISSDLFGSKPLWYAIDGNKFGASSYKTALLRSGIKSEAIIQVPANQRVIIKMLEFDDQSLASKVQPSFEVADRQDVYSLDLRQFKTGTEDWQAAFRAAVEKRTRSFQIPFIGLSSGYDSGLIDLVMNELGVYHEAISVKQIEDFDVIYDRTKYGGNNVNHTVFEVTEEILANEVADANAYSEPFEWVEKEYPVRQALVCHKGKDMNPPALIYMSGCGGDEIISDYGFNGTSLNVKSQFGGLFPENLSTIFPWNNFFKGSMRRFLRVGEYGCGRHGIESRYPFLDFDVVQECLWLTAEVKNSVYKRPIYDYFQRFGYPFDAGVKRGLGNYVGMLKKQKKENQKKKEVEQKNQKNDKYEEEVRAKAERKIGEKMHRILVNSLNKSGNNMGKGVPTRRDEAETLGKENEQKRREEKEKISEAEERTEKRKSDVLNEGLKNEMSVVVFMMTASILFMCAFSSQWRRRQNNALTGK